MKGFFNLRKFKAVFPKVKLVFKPAHSDDMARKQLMDGLLNVAFIMDNRKPVGSLKVEKLMKEDLKDETLLLTETGCSYRNMFKETLHSFGIYPLDQIEFASIEAIKQSVIAGLGVALLPEMVVKNNLKRGERKH